MPGAMTPLTISVFGHGVDWALQVHVQYNLQGKLSKIKYG